MLPRQVRRAVRLTREADHRAFGTVSLSEIVQGVTRAVSLITVNFLLVGASVPGTFPGGCARRCR
ncbi:hypothetical protein ACWEPA_17010 [Streptomyces filamentosus]